MRSTSARVIIPLAIAFWLGAILVLRDGVPGVLQAAFVIGFAIAIPVAVLHLMASMGWSTLARNHPLRTPFTGRWQLCPTGQISTASVEDPAFARNRLRLVSALRVGITDRALHLSMIFSKVPLLRRFFPEVEIPWTSVTSRRTFEAPGWFMRGQPGALVRLNYDPNCTGRFVELEVGVPPVYLQLPAALFADVESRLPVPATDATPG